MKKNKKSKKNSGIITELWGFVYISSGKTIEYSKDQYLTPEDAHEAYSAILPCGPSGSFLGYYKTSVDILTG